MSVIPTGFLLTMKWGKKKMNIENICCGEMALSVFNKEFEVTCLMYHRDMDHRQKFREFSILSVASTQDIDINPFFKLKFKNKGRDIKYCTFCGRKIEIIVSQSCGEVSTNGLT